MALPRPRKILKEKILNVRRKARVIRRKARVFASKQLEQSENRLLKPVDGRKPGPVRKKIALALRVYRLGPVIQQKMRQFSTEVDVSSQRFGLIKENTAELDRLSRRIRNLGRDRTRGDPERMDARLLRQARLCEDEILRTHRILRIADEIHSYLNARKKVLGPFMGKKFRMIYEKDARVWSDPEFRKRQEDLLTFLTAAKESAVFSIKTRERYS